MNKKRLKAKKIGVLMGGRSTEREVSLRSGNAIYSALKSAKYDVAAIDAAGDLCSLLKKEGVDIAFLALHGGHGENGAIQGLLEILGIPYTGSGILASALAMDKEASKKVFLYHGIPVPPFKIVQSSELGLSRFAERGRGRGVPDSGKGIKLKTQDSRLKTGFSLPWVVKPTSEGSSVGVEIVRDGSKLMKALKEAFSYGRRVLVEKYIQGREIQIGILNDKILGGVEVRPSLEFYNYKAKYTSGLTEYIIPPGIDKKAYESSKKAALSAHRALGCGGATRVDLILDQGGNPFVLEVNTIPGMTETSLLPKIAMHAGLDFPSLLEEILGGAIGEA